MTAAAVAIAPDDELSRLLFSPKDSVDGIGPVSVPTSLIFPSDANYSESMNCNRHLANVADDNHAQGLEKARRDTEARAAKQKPGSNYEGYATVGVAHVVEINEGGHTFLVTHTPNVHNAAHCDVQLRFPGTKPGKAERGVARLKLADGFSPIVPPSVRATATPANEP